MARALQGESGCAPPRQTLTVHIAALAGASCMPPGWPRHRITVSGLCPRRSLKDRETRSLRWPGSTSRVGQQAPLHDDLPAHATFLGGSWRACPVATFVKRDFMGKESADAGNTWRRARMLLDLSYVPCVWLSPWRWTQMWAQIPAYIFDSQGDP